MKAAVRYVSRAGNTKKLADAVAGALGVSAHPVTVPLEGNEDILFVGGALYAGKLDKGLTAFLGSLKETDIKKLAVFGTSAAGKHSAEVFSSELAAPIPIQDSFFTPGKFLFVHRSRPDAADERNAAEWAKKQCHEISVKEKDHT